MWVAFDSRKISVKNSWSEKLRRSNWNIVSLLFGSNFFNWEEILNAFRSLDCVRGYVLFVKEIWKEIREIRYVSLKLEHFGAPCTIFSPFSNFSSLLNSHIIVARSLKSQKATKSWNSLQKAICLKVWGGKYQQNSNLTVVFGKSDVRSFLLSISSSKIVSTGWILEGFFKNCLLMGNFPTCWVYCQ